jgi:hypothetical protein
MCRQTRRAPATRSPPAPQHAAPFHRTPRILCVWAFSSQSPHPCVTPLRKHTKKKKKKITFACYAIYKHSCSLSDSHSLLTRICLPNVPCPNSNRRYRMASIRCGSSSYTLRKASERTPGCPRGIGQSDPCRCPRTVSAAGSLVTHPQHTFKRPLLPTETPTHTPR